MGAEALRIEVAFALPRRQTCLALSVAPGTTLRDAILQSGILAEHPEIDLQRNAVGIFGRLRTLDDVVGDGDRVEIYRELRADPKETRRQRARQQAR